MEGNAGQTVRDSSPEVGGYGEVLLLEESAHRALQEEGGEIGSLVCQRRSLSTSILRS
jgi:hypothetical protein